MSRSYQMAKRKDDGPGCGCLVLVLVFIVLSIISVPVGAVFGIVAGIIYLIVNR